MIEIQVYDSPLSTVRLERFEADDEDDAGATAELLAAADDLARGWLLPLGIGLRIDCLERENFMQASPTVRPAKPHWFLRRAELPADVHVQAPFTDSQTQLEPQLDAQTIARWVKEATVQPCADARHVTALGEMRWTIIRARLPVPGDLVTMDGPHVVPSRIETIDGARWATAPIDGPQQPPLLLRAVNDHGVTSIWLETYWSAWVDHPALVGDAVERVLARGRGWEQR